MYAVPLKDGHYYIKAEYFAPLDDGKIVNKEEIIKLLNKVKESYDKEGFIYYYEGHLLQVLFFILTNKIKERKLSC